MKVFGIEIRRGEPAGEKAAPPAAQVVDSRSGGGGWVGIIRDWFPGAWQRDMEKEWTTETVLAYSAVYSCITLIAQDVGKLRPKLMELGKNGIWTETDSSAFSPVLKKPNDYQNHIQFKEWWITSKLVHGNAYALKVRDKRGVVVQLYLLDPTRVAVLVAPDGSVFYRLAKDNLSGLEEESVTVPASEIIHDRMNCLFHPLVGVSPIYACGAAADAGLKIQKTSARFAGKGVMPSGVLSAPHQISQETAERLKTHWQSEFSGDNAGAVAVLGEGLKWEPMRMTAVDAQLIEQLKWSAETVCSTFHVPPFKVGIGPAPTYPNAAAGLNQIYYSDCLQSHIEAWELVMDEGLGLTETTDRVLGVELELKGLLRMDAGAQITSLAAAVGGSIMAPNEARREIDLPPKEGGDSPMIQQQNYSLAALAKRDAKPDPFAGPTPPAPPAPPPAPPPSPPPDGSAKEFAIRLAARFMTRIREAA